MVKIGMPHGGSNQKPLTVYYSSPFENYTLDYSSKGKTYPDYSWQVNYERSFSLRKKLYP